MKICSHSLIYLLFITLFNSCLTIKSSGESKSLAVKLSNIKSGQTIRIEEGEYTINAPIKIERINNFKIEGSGKVLIKMADNVAKEEGGIFIVRDCSDFVIKNLILDANIENRLNTFKEHASHNLRLLGTSNFIIDSINCISAIDDCMTIQESKITPSNGSIKNSTFSNYWRSGLSIISGENISINKCNFHKTGYSSESTGGGINVEENNWNKFPVRNISIDSCNFISSSKYGIQLSSKGLGGKNIKISNSSFSNIPLAIYSSLDSVVIEKCFFHNISISDAKLSNVIRCVRHTGRDKVNTLIKGNIFRDNNSNIVIYCNGDVNSVVIEENNFIDNLGFLIGFYGKKAVVKNNNIYGQERAIISILGDESNAEISYNKVELNDSYFLHVNSPRSTVITKNNEFRGKEFNVKKHMSLHNK